MGLDLETCLDIFNYHPYPVAEVRRVFQQTPRNVGQGNTYQEEELISSAYHEFFRLHRLRGHGPAQWRGGELMLVIVIKGEAVLVGGKQRQPARAGQTFLLPGAAESWTWERPAGNWEILLAKLPVVRPSSLGP
jgi:mannose-6-phosphate isomerase